MDIDIDQYSKMAVAHLTSQEERYVNFVLRGINPSAAARQAGYSNPIETVGEFAHRTDIQTAIAHGREVSRQLALQAGALEFTKEDATRLYLEAHALSDTSADKIKAVDSLVKLHGLAEPERKELVFGTVEQMREMDTEALMELAESDIELDPSQYAEKE